MSFMSLLQYDGFLQQSAGSTSVCFLRKREGQKTSAQGWSGEYRTSTVGYTAL